MSSVDHGSASVLADYTASALTYTTEILATVCFSLAPAQAEISDGPVHKGSDVACPPEGS